MTVEAVLNNTKECSTQPLYQYDQGQKIHLSGIDLPASYLAEFSNEPYSVAEQIAQTTDTVTVPDKYLTSGKPVFVWIVVVDNAGRTTRYAVFVPVKERGEPANYTPSPSEQTAIEAAISALEDTAEELTEMIAPEFVQATANQAGTYVINSDNLYDLPNGHTANATWANTTKTQTTVSNELKKLKDADTELKSAITDAVKDVTERQESDYNSLFVVPSENIFDGTLVPNEQVATSTGAFVEGVGYYRSNHIPISAGSVYIGIKNLNAERVLTHYCLYNSAKEKLTSGQYNSLTISTADDMLYVELTASQSGYVAFDVQSTYKEDDLYISQVTPTKYVPYVPKHFDPELVEVDTTLEKSGIPADAKTVGDKIAGVQFLEDNLIGDNKSESTSELSLTWTTGHYVLANGTIMDGANYKYSSKIPVSEGDILTTASYDAVSFRFVCAYSNNTAVAAKGSNDNVTTYTVPEGIDEVVVSVVLANNGIYKTVVTHETVITTQIEIDAIRGGNLTTAKSASLTTGNGLYLFRSSLLRNKKYVFKADVSGNDWSILIAHGVVDNSYDANTYSQGFIITPNTATPWSNGKNGESGTTGTAWTHGLNIGERLCIVISVGNDQKYSLSLMSESGMVSKSYDSVFNGRKGSIYAKSISGTFANAILSFGCSDLEKPIWLFGDSYVSIVENRYPYWMVQANIDNCLINSYPGEASPNALKDAKQLLEISTPRFLIWGLGMNDHDSTTAVNPDWLSAVTELTEICEEKKITLILATIPNVTHTSYNNVQKNAWIRSHDYRYVEFATAIGAAEEVGAEWPDGWLDSDGVHPTEMGARVLAMQIMADVPELNMP